METQHLSLFMHCNAIAPITRKQRIISHDNNILPDGVCLQFIFIESVPLTLNGAGHSNLQLEPDS